MGDAFGSDEAPDTGSPVVLGHVAPFTVGRLRVEPALRRVSSEQDNEEFVQPRVMQVLVALARARGQVLTRDDLIDSCWGGTIVGDDAINRIVSHVRKLAEGIGQGAFSVETVARVGYRLRCRDEPEAVPPGPRRRRPSHTGIWAAVILLLTALAAGWWLLRPSAGAAPTLQLGRFEAVGAGVPAGLPATLDSELRTALGDRDVVLKADGADLILAGSVRPIEQGRFRVSIQVNDAAGRMLWSNSADLAADDLAGFAGFIAFAVECAITGAARHDGTLSREALSLTLQACGADPGRRLAAGRRLAQANPDYWMGWYHIVYAINTQASNSST